MIDIDCAQRLATFTAWPRLVALRQTHMVSGDGQQLQTQRSPDAALASAAVLQSVGRQLQRQPSASSGPKWVLTGIWEIWLASATAVSLGNMIDFMRTLSYFLLSAGSGVAPAFSEFKTGWRNDK